MNSVLVATLYLLSSAGSVNLSLHPVQPVVPEGGTAQIALIATADDDPELVYAMDVILHWDPAVLGAISVDNNGPFSWIVAGFLPNPDGINTTLDDGDAVFTALAPGSLSAMVTSNGMLVATFAFPAEQAAAASPVEIVAQQGNSRTRVFAPSPPQTNILGGFDGTVVTILACSSADWDSDGDVDLVDFAALQRCFTGPGGSALTACACAFDFDADVDVDTADHTVFESLLTGPSGP